MKRSSIAVKPNSGGEDVHIAPSEEVAKTITTASVNENKYSDASLRLSDALTRIVRR